MEEDFDEQVETNPLRMALPDFISWMSGRGLDIVEPPKTPLERASLLLEAEEIGRVHSKEVKLYLKDLGLMRPPREN